MPRPFSISVALAMMMVGCSGRTQGKTRGQESARPRPARSELRELLGSTAPLDFVAAQARDLEPRRRELAGIANLITRNETGSRRLALFGRRQRLVRLGQVNERGIDELGAARREARPRTVRAQRPQELR
jgi:hypothetical protein